jgi:hypothetical protein
MDAGLEVLRVAVLRAAEDLLPRLACGRWPSTYSTAPSRKLTAHDA